MSAVGNSAMNRVAAVALGLLVLVLLAAGWLLRPSPTPAPAPRIVPPRIPAQGHPPALRFTDITLEAGIDFVHHNGARGDKLLPETLGGGVALCDLDRDGDPDLVFVNGSDWPDVSPRTDPAPSQAFYRNDGTGHFTNASAEVGLDLSFYGMGVACGDHDGDGWVDLYFTAVGANHLLRNERGQFREVTLDAGVAGPADAWSTSATFLDYDRDGDLDLFVLNYVVWSRQIDLEVDFRLAGVGRAYGPPTAFAGSQPLLFRNEGDGRFTEVAEQAGVQVLDAVNGDPLAKGLGVMPLDFDGDGWPDLFVGNDTVRNLLFHNLGDGRFEEVGELYGVAFDRNGAATGAMGVDVADYRNDGSLGIAVGNFANEMSSLYVTQNGGQQFADESIIEGLGAASRQALTFGLLFLDVDLDGRLDLVQANGHLEQEINRVQSSQQYAQPAQLFWNCGEDCERVFQLVEDTGDLAKPLVGRGLAQGDIDGDGDPDLVITQVNGPPRLLRNDQTSGNHWLRVALQGPAGNPQGHGAELQLKVGTQILRRKVTPTRGYLSQSEVAVTFGLGSATRSDELTITWPDGLVQTWAAGELVADQRLRVEHPSLSQ